jgi:integrase
VSWRVGGRQRRKFFTTQESAKLFASDKADEIKRLGAAWSELPASTRAEMLDVWRRAEECGYSVAEACRAWESAGKARGGGLTLAELVNRCVSAKAEKGLRPESLRIFTGTVTDFIAGRETKPAADITTPEVAGWIASRADWGAWRRRGALTDLSTLFSWGMKSGLVPSNPARAVERPVLDDRPPEIFTAAECRAVLELTRASYPDLLPWLSLCLFAGVRPGEVERLSWAAVGADHVHIAGASSKTRQRRLIACNEALRAWLAVCPEPHQGPICGPHHAKRYRELHAACARWPRDVLRHSYVSYELARSQDMAATALQSGHSEEVLMRHYRELVPRTVALEFWSIRPQAAG